MSTLPSIVSYKKHGIPRSFLNHLLLNWFYFPKEYQDLLWNYYILHWSGSFLKAQLKQGTILHQNRLYIVIFHRCTHYDAVRADQVKLSFRVPMEEYELPSYVLITVHNS